MRRAWTPDRIILVQGERLVEQSPKRDCDLCRTRLGDLTDNELVIAGRPGRRLPAVNGECALCLGFHAVLVEPILPAELNGDFPTSYKLLCPGAPAGAAVSSCAAWAACGCTSGPDVEAPSDEWVAFLATPCPTSPTGEHRHLVEHDQDGAPFVAAPQPKSCRYLDAVWRGGDGYLYRQTRDFYDGPGLYPVEIEEFDTNTLVFESLDITPHQPAEVQPL